MLRGTTRSGMRLLRLSDRVGWCRLPPPVPGLVDRRYDHAVEQEQHRRERRLRGRVVGVGDRDGEGATAAPVRSAQQMPGGEAGHRCRGEGEDRPVAYQRKKTVPWTPKGP